MSGIPHKAVISISSLIYDLLPTGECSGVSRDYQAKTIEVFDIDLERLKDRVKRILDEVRDPL